MSFSLPEATRNKLTQAADRHTASFSELIVKAINRCLADDVWVSGKGHSSNASSVVPPSELVELTNQFLRLAMAFELISAGCRESDELKEARHMIQDAQSALARIQNSDRCTSRS